MLGTRKIVETGLSAEDHYEVLDLQLTELLDAAGVDIEGEVWEHIILYDRRLRIALGLPVMIAN